MTTNPFRIQHIATAVALGALLLMGCAREKRPSSFSDDLASSDTLVADTASIASSEVVAPSEGLAEATTEEGFSTVTEEGSPITDSKPVKVSAVQDDKTKAAKKDKPVKKEKGEKKKEEKKTAKKPTTKAATVQKTSNGKKVADTKKTATTKPDIKNVAEVKKPAAKPTLKKAVPQKTESSKPEPKALAGSAAVKTAEVSDTKATNLITLSKESFLSLSTYENELEDMNVTLSKLQPWDATANKTFAGNYAGQLGSEVASIRVSPSREGQVNLVFGYSTEVVSPDGLIEQKTGNESYTNIILKGSTLSWPRKGRIYTTQGQFVKWVENGKTEYGLLVRGKAGGKPEFSLLRKVKALI